MQMTRETYRRVLEDHIHVFIQFVENMVGRRRSRGGQNEQFEMDKIKRCKSYRVSVAGRIRCLFGSSFEH